MSNKKIGHWIEKRRTYPEQEMSNYYCSVCGKIGGIWISHLKADRTLPECRFCGAKMSGKRVEYVES